MVVGHVNHDFYMRKNNRKHRNQDYVKLSIVGHTKLDFWAILTQHGTRVRIVGCSTITGHSKHDFCWGNKNWKLHFDFPLDISARRHEIGIHKPQIWLTLLSHEICNPKRIYWAGKSWNTQQNQWKNRPATKSVSKLTANGWIMAWAPFCGS